jgi:hypothetical protein
VRPLGWMMSAAGAALAIYSFPFASYVAIAFFLLGTTGIVLGLRLALRRTRPR